MVNVGQLVREERGETDVVLVGFSSYRGSVIAGSEWGAPMRVMTVPPARSRSWKAILHETLRGDRLLLFERVESSRSLLEPRGHRAIGVVYRPQYESYGNYVPTVLPKRYDALAYLDETNALHPFHLQAAELQEVPETYPSGV